MNWEPKHKKSCKNAKLGIQSNFFDNKQIMEISVMNYLELMFYDKMLDVSKILRKSMTLTSRVADPMRN